MQNRPELLFQPYTRHVLRQSAYLPLEDQVEQYKRQQLDIVRTVEARDIPLATSNEIADMVDLDTKIKDLEIQIKRIRGE